LIEGKLGILQYIEEEGVIPKGTNASLLKKLDDTFTNSRFEVSKKIALGFTIRHYAGTVLYNVDSFIQKNKDTFQSSLLMCLLESNICIMKLIFEEEIASTSENLDESRGTRPRFRESISPAKMPNKKGTSAKIRSVGTLVSFALNAFLKILLSSLRTKCHC
jgi:myosin heavy subunit